MLHLTPANLFEGSRQLCLILPTHRPLLYCPNHGKPPLPEQPRSLYLHLITSTALQLLLQLLLQITDICAVTFITGISSCLILQVLKLHRSCSHKFAKCIALAFVQVCNLHHNCTCDAWQFFAVPLLAARGQASGVD